MPLERVAGCSVYSYADELIVELTGEDEDGIIVVVSYQFEFASGESVTPKGTIDPAYEQHVADGLADEGYVWPGGPDG